MCRQTFVNVCPTNSLMRRGNRVKAQGNKKKTALTVGCEVNIVKEKFTGEDKFNFMLH